MLIQILKRCEKGARWRDDHKSQSNLFKISANLILNLKLQKIMSECQVKSLSRQKLKFLSLISKTIGAINNRNRFHLGRFPSEHAGKFVSRFLIFDPMRML